MTTSLLTLKHETTPAQYAEFIRAQGPISWWQTGGYWLVTDYTLAKQILLDERFSCDRSPFFIRRMPEIDLPVIQHFFAVVKEMMVMTDSPTHYPRRRICTHGLQHFLYNQLPHIVDDYLQRALAGIKTSSFDFVATVAEPLPAKVMAALFGIPAIDEHAFYRAAHCMTMFFGGASQYTNEEGARVDKAALFLHDYLHQLLHDTQHTVGLVSHLREQQAVFNLSDEEIIAQMIMLLVAGQVTLTDQLCHNLYSLLTCPSVWSSLVANQDMVEKALDEANRLDPAVTFTFRVAKENISFVGCEIKSGDAVFISNHAVNRDPDIFDSPESFILNRSSGHLSLGFGTHFCLGAKIGMAQMKYTIIKLLGRFPKLTVDEQQSLRCHDSLAFSGFARLVLNS